jgi:periplasmic divalent cation tolerance protein
MTDKILVLVNCPTEAEAGKIAAHLVELRLAACVTTSASISSVYHWQGAIEDAQEFALTIKTRRSLLPLVMAEILKLHSYTTPEILAVPVLDGSADYLAWMERELRQEE